MKINLLNASDSYKMLKDGSIRFKSDWNWEFSKELTPFWDEMTSLSDDWELKSGSQFSAFLINHSIRQWKVFVLEDNPLYTKRNLNSQPEKIEKHQTGHFDVFQGKKAYDIILSKKMMSWIVSCLKQCDVPF